MKNTRLSRLVDVASHHLTCIDPSGLFSKRPYFSLNVRKTRLKSTFFVPFFFYRHRRACRRPLRVNNRSSPRSAALSGPVPLFHVLPDAPGSNPQRRVSERGASAGRDSSTRRGRILNTGRQHKHRPLHNWTTLFIRYRARRFRVVSSVPRTNNITATPPTSHGILVRAHLWRGRNRFPILRHRKPGSETTGDRTHLRRVQVSTDVDGFDRRSRYS